MPQGYPRNIAYLRLQITLLPPDIVTQTTDIDETDYVSDDIWLITPAPLILWDGINQVLYVSRPDCFNGSFDNIFALYF